MNPEDQAAQDEKRARRKRKWQTVGHILLLLMSCTYYGVFLAIAWTGYLSWIGIAVGSIFLAPNILTAVAGLAGKKALEKRLGRACGCLMIATLAALVALAFWPERPGSWQPYSFDAELAALEAERAVPEEENAALRYDAVLADVNVKDRPELGEDEGDILRRLSRAPWRGEDQPEVAAWLDAHGTLIEELIQIGQLERCQWPVYANSECEWTVPYRKLGYGVRLLALTGSRHLGEGRFNEALKTYFCLLRCAEHLYQQTHNVDFLGAFRLEGTALPMIRYALVGCELSSEEMEDIARRLPEAVNAWNSDIDMLLRFDEYRFAQFMAPVYEINEHGEVRFSDWIPFSPEEQPNRKGFRRIAGLRPLYYHLNMPLAPDGIWAMARQESTRMRRFLQSGPVLRINTDDLNPFSPLFGFLARAGANWTRNTARIMCFDDFLYASFGERYGAHLTQRRGTWLVLGLRRYRDEHGAWPASLDQVSQYIPNEAFQDPTSGDGFVYAMDDDGFKLYSKGINRVDEGGRDRYVKELDRVEDDIAIWPSYVPEPPESLSQEETEEMFKQLAEIYGEDSPTSRQEDANHQ